MYIKNMLRRRSVGYPKYRRAVIYRKRQWPFSHKEIIAAVEVRVCSAFIHTDTKQL